MCEEANTTRNLVGQLNALIAEMEALEDQGELFDTLMDLKDDREGANTKLQGLNALIAQAEQEIKTKEAQVQAMNRFFDPGNSGAAYSTEGSCFLVVIYVSPSTLGTERPKELEDRWYPGLMAFICYFVRVTLSQHRRLIAELKALGQRGDALRALEGPSEDRLLGDVVSLQCWNNLLVYSCCIPHQGLDTC
ncbi:hypothetical protein Tco_1375857 [Tanacetum coccineum]